MGYFRILYYISYIFNTVSRLIRRNKKFFIILLLIGIILFLFMNKSQAYYYSDYTYADPNYAIENIYNDINMDFLKRLNNYNGNNKSDFVDLLKNNAYSFYLYYGRVNGQDMINGITYNHANLRIFIYRNSVSYISTSASVSDNYFQVSPIDLKELTSTSFYVYYFDSFGNLYEYPFDPKPSSLTVTIPSNFINTINTYSYNYLFNNYSLQDIELLYEMNNNLGNIENTITDDTVSSDTTDTTDDIIQDSIDIFDNSYTSTYNSQNTSFLNKILTPIQQMVDGTTTKSVTFTLPFVNYSFTISSNTIYSHISTTALYTLIQLFWWVTFSIPIYKLLRRIIIWLGTGEFINKPSKFAIYMSDFISQNITPGMM